MRHELVSLKDFEAELPEIMEKVAYFKRRILLTYQGVPMVQIVPMMDAAVLNAHDDKIFTEMAKEAEKHDFYADEPTTPIEELNRQIEKELKAKGKLPKGPQPMKKDAEWAPFAKQMVRYLKRRRRVAQR